MKITNFAINHSTAIFVLIACILFGGVFAYNTIPKEAAPDVQIPMVIVSTAYPGVSPADIESLVTQPLEREFKGIRDLEEMTSTSAESVSLITLEFDPNVNIDEALQKVRDEVDKAESDLPDDAEEPEVIEINASDWPVMIANVSGDLDLLRLKELGEELQEDIEEQPGVLRVDIAGAIEREIQINVDPDALDHHGISLNQITAAIQQENVNLPGGSLEMGAQQYTVRVPGEFEEVPPIADIVVAAPEGEAIFLRDVAEVKDGFKDPTTRSRLTTWQENEDGEEELVTQPNISLSVVKRAGANILDVAQASHEVIEEYEGRYASEGLKISVLNDMSKEIESAVTELQNNIISGLLIVLIVLFFFMGGMRNAFFVGIAIPMSMLLSFIVLLMLDVTMNMVVLFALILALGMLVDNAIVVVENIYRHASEGKSRMQAAIDGTKEVGWPIIAATATTVSAFLPLLFWPGVMGEFMGYLPLTVIIVLACSLFVALVINPTICAAFLRVKEGVSFDEDEVPDIWIYRFYRRSLEWSMDRRALVMVLASVALIGSVMLFGKTTSGVEFFPETTPDKFTVNVENPDGTRLDETDRLLQQLAEPLEEGKGLVEAWIADAGVRASGENIGPDGGNTPHQGKISVELVEVQDQPSSPYDFMDRLREMYSDVAGANIFLEKQDMGPPSGEPINVEIRGEDLQELEAIATEVRETLRRIEGVIDLKDDIELSRPEIQVRVDRSQAAVRGLDTQTIAQTVRTAVNGTEASVFREGEDEYDITVRLRESERDSIDDLEKLTITDAQGERIPLLDVANVEVTGGTGSIRHLDRERVVTVSADAAQGYLPNNLLQEAQQELQDLELPPGYEIAYTGEQEDQEEAGDFLAGALLAALFLITLVLVTEFDSIVQPVIILFSVVLSLIGVFWSLIITNEPFGIIMTSIGIISLAGVVVNNAIVMIDYINKLRERGHDRREAIITGGLVRFRPVMLTAITTIGGLLPIVIGVSLDFVNQEIVVGGNSVEMWGPMAWAVTTGLLVATVLTLIVVPVLYSLLDDVSQFGKRMWRWAAGAGLVFSLFLMAPGLNAQQLPSPDEGTDQPASAQQHLAQQDVDQDELDEDEELDTDLRDEARLERRGLRPMEELEEDEMVDADRTLELDEVRQLAREQNLDVQLAEQQVEVAGAQIRSAFSMILPRITASGNYIINQEEITADFDFGDMPMPGGDGGGPDEFVTQPKTQWSWEVGATIPLNARAYPGIQLAYGQEEQAEVQSEAAREQVDFAAVQLYYNMVLGRQMVDIARQQLVNAETMLRATERRLDAGQATEFERNRANVRVVEAERDLEQARLSYVRTRQSLAQLLQTDADFDVTRPDEPASPASLDELKEVAEQERYIVEAERINERLAELSRDEVYYRYLPSLTTTFQYFDQADTDLMEQDPQWQIVFGASWDLWDGGEREALLDERRAQLVSAQIQTQQTLSELDTDLEHAWADYLSAQSQVAASREQFELAQQALRQAEIGYEQGVTSQLDLIDAQDSVITARMQFANDQLQLEMAIRELRYLAGID